MKAIYCVSNRRNPIAYLTRELKIDEYITHRRCLADIDEAFNDMHVSSQSNLNSVWALTLIKGGNCIRCVVDMS